MIVHPIPPIALRTTRLVVLPFGAVAALCGWIALDQAAFVWRVIRGR